MKSDVEDLMPRLLPIECSGDTSTLLNLDGPPRNPQEYLRQVQLEAALCPEVVVAQIDPKKLKKQTVNIPVAECHAAPAGFSPSLAWQQRQVSNFSHVRQSITKDRQHWSSHSLDDNVVMPKQADEEGWKSFCLGELLNQGALSSHTDAETGLDYSKVGFPPFLSIVSRLSQSTVLTVLDILINWFEDRDFEPQLGHWLYALLAALEKPLLPEAHSSIRQLARRCARLRSQRVRTMTTCLPSIFSSVWLQDTLSRTT
ncbi:gem-associated protein 2 isoform X2 [Syngnathus typhle]|uniref:gem-associated protein 2 isoform X2 n=1 Tax=Syngnathus typhle TaxID=161592 RepID=UPI002A6A0588|nr:gem-associated protein 2 isoform X2 [Syngnathus typhle]